ncbi:MAG: hypothetical protein K0R69_331 [Clostridia bacterium]|nr:hypothetical protein [Clostridia bacterium]
MEKYGASFKELSFKKKISHIWEYYRWHIIGSIIGIIVLGNLVVTILTPQKNYSVDVVVAGRLASDETQPQVIEKFENELDTSLNIASVDFANMGQLEMVMMQKIPLLMRTNELDILILSKDAYMNYLNQGGIDMFMPLDTIKELTPLLEEKKDSLITSEDIKLEETDPSGETKIKKLEGENHVYGITVNKLNNIPCIAFTEELVVGVTSVAKDIPRTAEMLDYLVE